MDGAAEAVASLQGRGPGAAGRVWLMHAVPRPFPKRTERESFLVVCCQACERAAAILFLPPGHTHAMIDQTRGDRDDNRGAARILRRRLDRIERRLPTLLAEWLAHLRHPSASWVRIPLGLLLIVGGFLGFLPILGFWMVPLGLMLLALDVALLRRPTAQLILSGERVWNRWRRRRRTS